MMPASGRSPARPTRMASSRCTAPTGSAEKPDRRAGPVRQAGAARQRGLGTGRDRALCRDHGLTSWDGTTAWTRRYLDGFGRVFRTAALGPDGSTAVISTRSWTGRGGRSAGRGPISRAAPLSSTGSSTTLLADLVEGNRRGAVASCVRPTTGRRCPTLPGLARSGEPDQRVERSSYRFFADKLHKALACGRQRAAGCSSLAYDALAPPRSTATDPLGIATCTSYDSLGLKTSLFLRRPDGGSAQDDPFKRYMDELPTAWP